jgi:predicted nucleic acid-binding protein
MIAADTSAWIDYAKDIKTASSRLLEGALEQGILVIPPLVLAEVLSSPKISHAAEKFILTLPRIELVSGYWERTALLRRATLKKGLKARIGDCLIAQSCIDQNIPLITGDLDFRHFVKLGLELVSE